MNVACYARVANADQLGLDHQVNTIREYANTCGHTVMAVIADNGVTGRENDTGLESILRLAKEGKITGVVCREPSRFSRDSYRLCKFQTTLCDLGVSILYLPPYTSDEAHYNILKNLFESM